MTAAVESTAAAATPPVAAWADWIPDWIDAPLVNIGDTPVTLLSVVSAVLAFVIALWLSRLIRGGIERLDRRGNTLNRASMYTLGRVIHYVLLLIGLLVALSLIGIDTGKLTIVAGALGVGLGFGLQSIFNNFISGLIILFERSLKVGDFVELESGVHGEVQEVRIRATRITTNDNIDILVPNSEFVNGRVVNWTLREISRRVRVPFAVAYGSDKEMVKKAALEAAAEVPFTLAQEGRRRPQVWLTAFGDSSLDFELVVWLTAEATKRPAAVRAAYTWALETALAKYGLQIPFPQRDLHLRTAFGLDGDQALAAFGIRAAVEDGAGQDEPVPELTRRERHRLSHNDAQADVQREIAEAPELPPSEQAGRTDSPLDKGGAAG